MRRSLSPWTNGGTFSQSGPQSWSPGRTFTNTAGFATFASDAGSTATRNLAMAITGGTVTAAITQHLQSVTIAGAGALDLTTQDLFLASAGYATLASYLHDGRLHTSATVPGNGVALATGAQYLLLHPGAAPLEQRVQNGRGRAVGVHFPGVG